MHTGELDMLANGISNNLSALCHGINLYLLSMLYELTHHNRMLL